MIPSTVSWAQQTWGSLRLGDKRLNRRAVRIGARMAAKPEASLPEQMKAPADLEAAYRLLNNRSVTMSALLAPSYARTRQLASPPGPVVLWVNDLTELDYSFHTAKTGLGPSGDARGQGFLLHTTLAIQAETRQVLGLGSQLVLLRQPAPKPRPKWTRSPEGLVWEAAVDQLGPAPEGARWVQVSDAGSDYFPYLATCRAQQQHFLIRVSRNRLLTWDEQAPEATQAAARKLVDYARSLPPASGSQFTLAIPAKKQQPVRQAELVLAWASVTLAPSPQAPPAERSLSPLQAWVLRVWEVPAPETSDAIEWILISSLPITRLSEAYTRVDWYTCRWFCEDLHQCLKTGCRIEKSQLDERRDLENLLGFVTPIAVRLLQLRQAARLPQGTLATQVVEPLMVEVLSRLQNLDSSQLTVQDFWRHLARLGGFQGRQGDGNPGWRILWRGWKYLSDLTDGARLMTQPSGP